MRLAHKNLDTTFDITPGKVNTLVVEEPAFYRKIIRDILLLFEAKRSDFVLSEGIDEIKIKDDIVFCDNFFSLEIGKKINTLLLKQLCYKIQADGFKYQELYQKGYEMLSELTFDYNSKIILTDNLDVNLLLKLYNPCVDLSYCETDLELLIEYVKTLVEFANLKVIFFLGIENYFTKDEIEQIIQHCKYKDVAVFLLESNRRYVLDDEKCTIIDKDLCEISTFN